MYGCSGGWMSAHWRFMRDHGAMTEKDYPYKAKNQTCAHDDSKTVGKVKNWSISG
jgi:hypothetical protein